MAFIILRAKVDKAIDTDTELYNRLLPCSHGNIAMETDTEPCV